MPDLDLTLARRATEIPGWRWNLMAGAMVQTKGGGRFRLNDTDFGGDMTWLDSLVPDYRDPATAGCLLELVDCCYVERARGVWQVTMHGGVDGVGSSLGSACIRAAETAGCWPGALPT